MVIGALITVIRKLTKTGLITTQKVVWNMASVLGKAGLVATITFGVFELINKSKEAYRYLCSR